MAPETTPGPTPERAPERGPEHTGTPLGTLRAAFERTGTPVWIMRVIRQQGFDRAAGFRLDLELTDDGYRHGQQATAQHLLTGEVDLIDSDWLSIGRLRHAGVPVAACHPYGRIMGGLVVDRQRWTAGLAGLAGRRIAVVSRLDKTWVLLRAHALAAGLTDPAASVELIETGAKHEALRRLRAGEVDGAILFWHLGAIALMEPRFQLAFDALDAVEALAGAPLPTTFFIAADALRRDRPDLLRAFAGAYDAAVAAMRQDAALWRRGVGDAATDAAAPPLWAAWLRRIGLPWPPRLPERLADCFATLKARVGGAALGLEHLPADTFDLGTGNER